MSVQVEVVTDVSDELVAGLNHLLPQLSTTALPLKTSDVEELVASPSTTVFIARDERQIVGTLTLVVFPIPTGRRAWIEDVVVDEAARGRGVAEALTKAAIEESRRREVRTIDLTTRSSREAANRLYVRLGFELRETNVYRFFLENVNTGESQ
ncbi:MAG TPA: GNAT family N-acetyltransferase [Acidimicrobiales bacterium]|nr:GNAT family N-acetyltransferase [Acidimicrobiales bacterium]